MIYDGLVRMVLGMSKKLLIANLLGKMVDECYVRRAQANSTMALFAILGYSLQLYFDFSGYTDMSIGIANILGFKPCENFESPYISRTVGEFWKRWHISLTQFFTKYIYIPLGGNRKGLARTCINIMIIFLISGLWHGADWKFVIWGAIYGAFLVLERLLKITPEKVPAIPGRIVTMIIVSLLWTLFRAESMEAAIRIIKEFFTFNFLPLTDKLIKSSYIPEIDYAVLRLRVPTKVYDYWPYCFLAFSLVLSQLRINTRQLCEKKTFLKKFGLIVIVLLAVLSTLSFGQDVSFIYSEF